jgi:hypothetical protein
MAKKSKKPVLHEEALRRWLLLQGGAEGAPIQVTPTLRLITASRNPCLLLELIRQGRFGDNLGRVLLSLVPPGQAEPPSDHEFRVVHGDGVWHAVFSIARQGEQRIAVLGFARCGAITEADRDMIWSLLSIAERLVRELLTQELAYQEGD